MTPGPSDRSSPFRDEIGSAHTRIAQLEQENDQLRQQLAGHRLVESRPRRAAVLLPLTISWGLLMTGALVRSSMHGPAIADDANLGPRVFLAHAPAPEWITEVSPHPQHGFVSATAPVRVTPRVPPSVVSLTPGPLDADADDPARSSAIDAIDERVRPRGLGRR